MKRPTDSERYQYWRRVGVDFLTEATSSTNIYMRLKGAALDEFTDERIEEEKVPEITRIYKTLKKRTIKKTKPRQK